MKVAGVLVVGGALALAVRAPLAVTVLGLIAFGVLHNLLELRYVAGRFAGVLSGRFLVLLVALVTGIAACRLGAVVLGDTARYAEIVLGYLVLAAGCAGGGLRRRWLAVAGAALAVAAAVSLRFPAYHFVVLAHLHNLVPLVFLWEWATRLPAAARRWFRLGQVGWVLVVPAAVLAGAADRWITGAGPDTVAAFAGPPARIMAVSAPPSAVDTQFGVRLLVVFAFLQTMHYVVWVGFLPRFAPDAILAFERRPGLGWLTGRRVWALGLSAGAVFAVLLISDYTSGRTWYGALASYHAYLEFPVLLALLTAPVRVSDPPKGVEPHSCGRVSAGS